jgi:nicotinate-nucleotide--dimethylbenzimidazole phosphoribosyltransferase
MNEELKDYLSAIQPPDKKAMEAARLRWAHVAKPLNSLGILEDDIVKIAGIRGNSLVKLKKTGLLILCADNGIVEEGVTQTGMEVTAVVAENMTQGNSSVCIMAKRAGVDVFPVDIGVARDLVSGSTYPLINRKIAYGTKNFSKTKAMTRNEAVQAVIAGIELMGELSEKGYDLAATGEMGIGNTTTSSAVAALLLKQDPARLTGRGAGLNDAGLRKKQKVIQEAVAQYGPNCQDETDMLSAVGGFDLAGMTGIFLGGAIYRIPVLLDGFISAVAALLAERIYPGCRDFMVASHVSAEPAGRILLEELGLFPLIQAGMCLGEGTGAVAAVPLLQMAADVYGTMSSFEDIEIEAYKPMEDPS